jgi:dihydropteroate synthase
MRASLVAGAAMINDIYALRMPGAVEVVAEYDCAVCLMHMQGEPLTMQKAPVYMDVVLEVRDFFAQRLVALERIGISPERVLLDPGFGFGKRLEHNLALLARLNETSVAGLPLLAGLSRKSMLGTITGRPVEQRESASIAAALMAVSRGARILRVHDVAATRDALAVWQAAGAA